MVDWREIVRAHGPFVYTTAWRVLGDAELTEEVVQEVFEQAHEQKSASAARGWRVRLGSLTALRSLERLRQSRDTLAVAASINEETADRLRLALLDLPRREAVAFCLRYFGDLTQEEIAVACRITPRAVAEALGNARARLESLLTGVAPNAG